MPRPTEPETRPADNLPCPSRTPASPWDSLLRRAPLLLATALVALTLPAAAAEAWRTVRLGSALRFQAPASLRTIQIQPLGGGQISGQYRARHFALLIDYGGYIQPYRPRDERSGRFASPAMVQRRDIGGRAAVLLTGPAASDPKHDCPWLADLYVAGPTPAQTLHAVGCGDGQGLAQLQRLYRSVRFGPG